ncbi:MAG: Lrp/AsnC family transcriptional regulator, partial [Candidatus Woesearchaeota archaeon]|nr:Lrp/AsnC family transcriptional regulator [Candidatus Woesearchaeota archaeon]
MKENVLDNKILAALDQDARSPESSIGKKVGVSKQVVKYRLKKLQDSGIVENYYTMIDVGNLGFDTYYIFIQWTGLNSKQESNLHQTIAKLPYVAWLITGIGRWDTVILICAQSIAEFNAKLTELKSLCKTHIHELTFTTLLQAEHISYKFLKTKTEKSLKTTSKNKIYSLDKTDQEILKTINHSARMPVTEIARSIKQPVHVVHYRLQQLKKEKIIQGFKPKINIQKLNMQWHLLLIAFNAVPEERLNAFINYCRQHKNVYYITNTVGKYDCMIDLHVKSTEEFREFLFDIKNTFEDIILL